MKSQIELDRQTWNRIESVFHRALGTSAAERSVLLDQLCGSDLTIRREVGEMLEAHERDQGLIAERRFVFDDVQPTPLDHQLAEGARIGPYRIISLIGAGGMGDVYRAERADGAYQQTVALKVLRPGYRTAEMVRRFRIEREALARLVHPGIATILDGGSLDDGRPYIVLQFVDGIPITTYCAEHSLTLHDRLALFLDVADAVQFAHARLVVHRDIKPSNILVQAIGKPRLLDFGIAKLMDVSADASLGIDTRPDVRLLTLAHAAPEQLRGEPPTTATDVFALGVLLFEMLTGSKPFAASSTTTRSLERAILDAPARTPSSMASSSAIARQLQGDLDRIVLMALRKEPERRYVSAAQFAEDVKRYLAGRPVLAQTDSVRYRAVKFIARNRPLVAGGAMLGLLLVAFGATAAVQARRISRERDHAEREQVAAEDVIGILTGLFERADPNKHPGGDTLRVTALLDDAEAEIARLNDAPARQATLLRTVGRMRAARGEYARAIDLLSRAYELRRAGFGPTDLEAARIHHEIAQIRVSFEGAAAARPMLDSSLNELRRLLGDEHQDVREAMGDLMMATSDSSVANALLARLLELERRSPSRDSMAIAKRLDMRATERYYAGYYHEAAVLFQNLFDVLIRQLPLEHERVRAARRDLAMAFLGEGRIARAESLQRVAAELEDRLHGPAMSRGMAREALALTFAAEDRADSAEWQEREALRLFREGAAPGHWRIWSAARNLAFIVAARGRAAEGLAFLDTAIAIAKVGPDTGTSVGYLIAQRVPFLLRLKRPDEAKEALAAGERLLGESPSVTAGHRADLHRYAGMIELDSGDPARAVARFRAAVALTESGDSPRSVPGLGSCLLGVGLVRLGQIAEARPLLDAPCSAYLSRGLAHPLIVNWIGAARARASIRAPSSGRGISR
jgi:eukaryotic-like serine/threonine-protein kinase